ncbi:MAG: MlaA family lipoprotein [Pontibacterium sp.]
MKKLLLRFVVLVSLTFNVPVLFAEDSPGQADPWQGFNRSIFVFNDTLDRHFLKPVTLGYKAVTPDLAERAVTNFFANLSDIGTLINNLLQGKPEAAGLDLARISFNTTFGLAGLIDVSTAMGIEKHHEDFGQTLGYWGVSGGPYLVLPFLGASTLRDTAGFIVDGTIAPVRLSDFSDEDTTRYTLSALSILDTRARLLDAETLISGDRYSFIRDAYLQRREYSVKDGLIEDYDDDNF